MSPTVTMNTVESSNIARIGWQDDTLYITFHTGATYSYAGVPSALYQELLSAESVGKLFHAKVKGKFEFQQILPAAC